MRDFALTIMVLCLFLGASLLLGPFHKGATEVADFDGHDQLPHQ